MYRKKQYTPAAVFDRNKRHDRGKKKNETKRKIAVGHECVPCSVSFPDLMKDERPRPASVYKYVKRLKLKKKGAGTGHLLMGHSYWSEKVFCVWDSLLVLPFFGKNLGDVYTHRCCAIIYAAYSRQQPDSIHIHAISAVHMTAVMMVVLGTTRDHIPIAHMSHTAAVVLLYFG